MWFLIILSALLFDVAFFFPDTVGFFILFSPLPLIVWLLRCPLSLRDGLRAGLFWGLIVFGAHFTWLLCLMHQHSAASWWLCGLVYGGVVAYFSLWSGVWLSACVVAGRFLSIIFSFTLITFVFFYSIEHWSLMPLGIDIGYPFINPRIPLAPYHWFVPIKSSAVLPSSWVYVPPVVNRIKNAHALWRSNPEGVGQKIFHTLADAATEHQSATLFVAPESMFSFPLNEYPHLVKLWTTALPSEANFLLGSVFHDEKGYYQTAFWLRKGLIINFYVKKILAPFVEKVPSLWSRIRSLRKAFLSDGSVEFLDHSTNGAVKYFDVDQSLRVIPRVCLEFFFMTKDECARYQTQQRNVVIAWFVNDSWFNEPFRQIMYNLAQLKAYELGFPVLMIGHRGLIMMNNKSIFGVALA